MISKTFSIMSWNCENLKNNIHVLKQALCTNRFLLVSLSETQLFQCDAYQVMQSVKSEYNYFLNSDDLHDPDLPSLKNRSLGGTMLLWDKDIDPYIEVLKPSSQAFLVAVLKLPSMKTSLHVTLYLPTHGKDYEFVTQIASLRNCLDDLIIKYSDPIIFIRGDSNVNTNNTNRVIIFQQLLHDYELHSVNIGHKTYHHFVGSGLYDSTIDVIIHSIGEVTEEVSEIICKQEVPAILSHHDIIISKFTQPCLPTKQRPDNKTRGAPRVHQTRIEVYWSPEGKAMYESLVGPLLIAARREWLEPTSQSCMSILLQLTNEIMNMAAKHTNENVVLGKKLSLKMKKIPKQIKKALNRLNRAQKSLKMNVESDRAKCFLLLAKKQYKQSIRAYNNQQSLARDKKLIDVCAKNPTKFFKYIKKQRKTQSVKIDKLEVGENIYLGAAVSDGFFESMTALKRYPIDKLELDPHLSDHLVNYDHILKLCQDHQQMPKISLKDSTSLLGRIKKNVKDFNSITALHYINAGTEGLNHFNLLLNGIIEDVNNASIEELNLVYGLILYKGHGKDRTSHRAYRCISTCPFLAKCLDLYIHDLYHDLWDHLQAPTQYQGSGSSHELASLLVTEVIQHSMYISHKPVFLLALDAESAFDRCLRQILCTELYKASLPGAAICYIDKRLASRKTIYEWDGSLMGPAKDDTGFEQGGINSSDFYKLYNNTQLRTSQESQLGINIESSVISAIGQADDVILVANDIYDLQLLVKLTENYCEKYRVKLEPAKTKLIAYSRKPFEVFVKIAEETNSVKIRGKEIAFSDELEHVGVVRNKNGNLPHIVNRIAKHKKALAAVLFTGAAKSHRGNPAASLRVHSLYCSSVLLQGIASLVLTASEVDILDKHFTTTLQNLQHLHSKTPHAAVHLLAGSLPFKALLAMRQLSLFSMICHLHDNPLNLHAKHVLTFSPQSAKSWFFQVRDLCIKYSLPHPLELLTKPVPRDKFKKLVKLKITEFWQYQYLSDCSSESLSSLKFLNPSRCSLLRPHNVWVTAGSSSYECNKAIVVARMLSGRYRTERLVRFWTNNKEGYCEADTCIEVHGDLEHLLISCPALHPDRQRLYNLWLQKSQLCPPLHHLFQNIISSGPTEQVKFILSPSAHPVILTLTQQYGKELLDHVYYLTRTFAFNMHRRKSILIGRWKYPHNK